jgi:hypothetical protein
VGLNGRHPEIFNTPIAFAKTFHNTLREFLSCVDDRIGCDQAHAANQCIKRREVVVFFQLRSGRFGIDLCACLNKLRVKVLPQNETSRKKFPLRLTALDQEIAGDRGKSSDSRTGELRSPYKPLAVLFC